jgi:hypothetical protein
LVLSGVPKGITGLWLSCVPASWTHWRTAQTQRTDIIPKSKRPIWRFQTQENLQQKRTVSSISTQ